MVNNLQREFNILLLSLRRNADRLHTNSGISEAQWRRDVRNHLQDFKIYQAIEWIDRDFYTRWIEPPHDWPELVGYNVAFNAERLRALKRAMRTGNSDVSGVIPLYQGVAPQQLEIELTEEIFVSNIHHNLDQLKRLRQLGVRLAIDDFGVGYSSLSYIKDFPIDLLKIDRSFITQVTERQDDATITSAIINLAHNLGIQVVAEGVETTSQLNFLRQHGCDVAQGYLISRPIPADQLEQWLKPQYAENPL
jgi:predicted signal transduction protein with EAL and GGDEF domain